MTKKLPHLTEDHHFAIANVAARASQLENQIERTIEQALLSQPKTAEFMLKNLGMDRVVSLLGAILLDAAPDEGPQIGNLLATINDLRSERNEILHWSWIPGMGGDTPLNATARPFREFRYSERTAEQVQKIADEMQDVVHALLEWQSYLRQLREKP